MGRQRQKKRGAPGVTHLRTDPDGVDVWRVRVFGTKDPKTGKVRADMQRRVRGTLAEAVAEREQFRREIEEADSQMGLPPTFGEFAAQWLERRLANGKIRASSARQYGQRIIRACEVLGDYIIDRIRTTDVEALVAQLEGRLHPRTINHTVSTTVTIIERWYAERGQVSPVRQVERLETPRRSDRKRALTADEVRRLLEESQGDRWVSYLHPLLLVMFSTGCRVGEALALRWSDLDEAAMEITIQRSSDVVEGPTKTGEVRVAPLHPSVHVVLRSHRRALVQAQGPGLAEGWIFPGRKQRAGRPIGQHTVRYHMRRLSEAVGIDPMRPHDTRRTHVDAARWASVDRAVVGDTIGHRSVEMNLHYSSVQAEERRRAVDAVMLQFGAETGHETGHEGSDSGTADDGTRYDDG